MDRELACLHVDIGLLVAFLTAELGFPLLRRVLDLRPERLSLWPVQTVPKTEEVLLVLGQLNVHDLV